MSGKSVLGRLDQLLFVDVDDKAALLSISGYHEQANISGDQKLMLPYPVAALKRLFQLAGETTPETLSSSQQRTQKFSSAEVGRLLTQAQQRLTP